MLRWISPAQSRKSSSAVIQIVLTLRYCWVVAILFAPLAAPAADSYLEAGVTADSLTNGYADWSGYYLNGSHKFAPRKSVYAGLLHAKRYDQTDDQFTGGGYYPLAQRTTLLAEGTFSSSHHFLPNWTTSVQVAHQLRNDWNLALGLHHRVYTATRGDSAKITVERYWSSFRTAYTLSLGNSSNLGSTVGHHLNGDYYYTDTNYIGLGVASGEELDSVGSSVQRSNVRAVYMRGLHRIAEDWGVTYQVSVNRQGHYYTRQGINLGLRYLF